MNEPRFSLGIGIVLAVVCSQLMLAQEHPQVPQSTNSQQLNITMTRSPVQPSSSEQQDVKQNLKDLHFGFDRYDLDDQAQQTLKENADWLKANPGVTVSIAGNADERGEIVYNLALSQKRAEAVRDALVSRGVSSDRIQFATGWGKLYPVCAQSDESCWAQNRRARLTAGSALQNGVLSMDRLTPAIMACATHNCF